MQALAILTLVWLIAGSVGLCVWEWHLQNTRPADLEATLQNVQAMVSAVATKVQAHTPPVTAKPTVLLRYRNERGEVVGEETILQAHRRPTRVYDGCSFMAARFEFGVWEYRQVQG